jgi:hypothetical protein
MARRSGVQPQPGSSVSQDKKPGSSRPGVVAYSLILHSSSRSLPSATRISRLPTIAGPRSRLLVAHSAAPLVLRSPLLPYPGSGSTFLCKSIGQHHSPAEFLTNISGSALLSERFQQSVLGGQDVVPLLG